MTRLVAVIACLGCSVISARGSATVVSARWAVARAVELATLLAEGDSDSLTIEILIVQILNGLLGIFFISVLSKSEGALESCYAN
jgi:hypothetical protein